MTTITKDKVVSMNYTLKDDAGKVLDSSQGEPLQYLQGHQNIIPGLERALDGLNVGAKKQVTVKADDGYGQYNPSLKFAVPADSFGGQPPQEGMMVQLSSPEGQPFVAKIVEVSPENVVLDANHPLAGQDLHFDVEITEVRDATQEELAHGHPHGPGGHHH